MYVVTILADIYPSQCCHWLTPMTTSMQLISWLFLLFHCLSL
jgi:hypothetical protein